VHKLDTLALRCLVIVGVLKESVAGERRVALVPDLVPKLAKAGVEVLVAPGAGTAAGFLDSSYVEKGARLEPKVFDTADILLRSSRRRPRRSAELKKAPR
jgi:NAD(P) transhydrogenase subunit alpha